MEKSNQTSSALPLMATEIPAPNHDAAEITALVKEDGKVTGYRLSNNQTLSKDDAVELARQGGIKGVGISERNGNEYLKSIPDGTDSNNLGNLPSFTSNNS